MKPFHRNIVLLAIVWSFPCLGSPQSASGSTTETLTYGISIEKVAYYPGEPVLLLVIVKNHSNQEVRVHLDESNFSFELFKNENESPFRTGKIKRREGISFDPDVIVKAESLSTYSLVLNEGISTRLQAGKYRVKIKMHGHFLIPEEIPGIVVRLEGLPAEVFECDLSILSPDNGALNRIMDEYLAEESRLNKSPDKGNYEIVRKKLLYAESNRAADFKAKILMEGRDVWEQWDAFESLKSLKSPEAIEALKKAKDSSAGLKGIVDFRKEIEKVIDAPETGFSELPFGQSIESIAASQGGTTESLSSRKEQHELMLEMRNKAQNYYERITSATTHFDLELVINDLRSNKVPTGLVDILLRNVTNAVDVRWTNPIPSMAGQDVSFIGGRCVWALKVILNCELPIITKHSSRKDLDTVVYRCLDARDEILKAINDKTENKPDLNPEEKLNLARDKAADQFALSRLAREDDSMIRRAVAANPSTSGRDLSYMEKWDEDVEVRQLAKENLKSARLVDKEVMLLVMRNPYFELPKRSPD